MLIIRWLDLMTAKVVYFFQIIRQYFSVIFALFKRVANGVDRGDNIFMYHLF